jgi:hypothetical protein
MRLLWSNCLLKKILCYYYCWFYFIGSANVLKNLRLIKSATRKVGMALEKASPGPPYVIDLAIVVLLLVAVNVVVVVVNAATGT